jgi:enoyl-CoA hydratase
VSELLTSSINGNVATVKINRPEKRNSLLPEMLESLDHILDDLSSDSNLRVLVITGAGDKAFSTGADLRVFSEFTPEQVRLQWVPKGHHIFRKLFDLPLVTVAKLNGDAFGGGLELALACDLRIARQDATVGFPENRVGTAPGWNGFQRAVELVGVGRAKELVLTGTSISAVKAENWGLINQVVDFEELDEATNQLIGEILKSAPISQKVSKQILNTFQSSHANYFMESIAGAYAHQTKDFLEGVAAFKEKRPSTFKGE